MYGLSTVAISYAAYKFSTNSKVRNIVHKSLSKIGSERISDIQNFSNYAIYSKKLGRNFTLEEMMDKGLI